MGSQDPEIERIVTAYMSPKQPAEARYAALYYANRVFPFTHSPTRHLALMGTDDGDHKVSAEARRGLRPYRYEPKELNTVADNRVPYPGACVCRHMVVGLFVCVRGGAQAGGKDKGGGKLRACAQQSTRSGGGAV